MSYLHSDIRMVERTEIIRDLHLGEFDILVGVNLLREDLRHARGIAGGDSGCCQRGVLAVGKAR